MTSGSAEAPTQAALEKKKKEEAEAKRKAEEEKAAALRREIEDARATEGMEVEGAEEKDAFDIFNEDSDATATVTKMSSTNAETTMLDSWDDPSGYYRFRLGDMLNSRYLVYAFQGKGVFSTVLRARDTAFENREIVIKVIRNNDTMHKAGVKELEFLKSPGRCNSSHACYFTFTYITSGITNHKCRVEISLKLITHSYYSFRLPKSKFSSQNFGNNGTQSVFC